MPKSLNRVQLIGNLTRDPELRYTPTGAAVCSFSIATNRNWTTDTGEKKEDVEFHRIIAWRKLAEICSQFLVKGRKVYVEGRLATRSWTAQDGTSKSTTEIVIEDMILLDSKRAEDSTPLGSEKTAPIKSQVTKVDSSEKKIDSAKQKVEKEKVQTNAPSEDVTPEDIPF